MAPRTKQLNLITLLQVVLACAMLIGFIVSQKYDASVQITFDQAPANDDALVRWLDEHKTFSMIEVERSGNSMEISSTSSSSFQNLTDVPWGELGYAGATIGGARYTSYPSYWPLVICTLIWILLALAGRYFAEPIRTDEKSVVGTAAPEQ